MLRFSILAVSLVAASAALADNQITVNWINNAGKSINYTQGACNPDGKCTRPSTIANGATGVLTHKAEDDTYLRSMIARYRYSDNTVYKSCQLTVYAEGPSFTNPAPGCKASGYSRHFIKSDGTGSSPTCTLVAEEVNHDTCAYKLTVRINN